MLTYAIHIAYLTYADVCYQACAVRTRTTTLSTSRTSHRRCTSCSRSPISGILNFLALLVQKYRYRLKSRHQHTSDMRFLCFTSTKVQIPTQSPTSGSTSRELPSSLWLTLTYAHVYSRMLTYAHVCSRMLTYAHVCSRILTYAEQAAPDTR
jgi:hypothetical protein